MFNLIKLKHKQFKYTLFYHSMKKSILISYVVLLIFIFSLTFDKKIVFAVSSLQETWINQIMVLVSYLGIFLILFILATCLSLLHDKKKIFTVWLSFAVTSVTVFLFKLLVHRIRPFEELGLNTLNFLIGNNYSSWNLSFPSFHTAIAFSAVPFFKGNLKKYWIVFSCLVGFSRLFFALHYLSDIIAGAVIGLAVGNIFMRIFHMENGFLK